ncbi:MAG: helix-turn-helix domain-containing protein [Clostridiales bacterium]|nr:helix-turn-helix domain-containing protein [Clostridiales bacterium]
MAVDYDNLGKRISSMRNKKKLSQEELGEKLDVTREYISMIETNRRVLSLDILVGIANILDCSTDDLLVDSLKHSVSTADSAIHRLLLDCNPLEEEILTETLKELKAILSANGI